MKGSAMRLEALDKALSQTDLTPTQQLIVIRGHRNADFETGVVTFTVRDLGALAGRGRRFKKDTVADAMRAAARWGVVKVLVAKAGVPTTYKYTPEAFHEPMPESTDLSPQEGQVEEEG